MILCYFVQKLCPDARSLASQTWRAAARRPLLGGARRRAPDRDHASRDAVTTRRDRRATPRIARVGRELGVEKRALISDFEKIFRIFFERAVRRVGAWVR
jgi:hypothetical protein